MKSQSYSEKESSYGRQVGERIRAIRRQKRLSLQDVEENSDSEFKASVLGAYERGERSISVPRLERLANCYGVPVDQLLPGTVDPDVSPDYLDLTSPPKIAGCVTINLTNLNNISIPESEMLRRYLVMIQVQRQDFNGRVLTIREDDMRAIACILGTEIDQVADRLVELKLVEA